MPDLIRSTQPVWERRGTVLPGELILWTKEPKEKNDRAKDPDYAATPLSRCGSLSKNGFHKFIGSGKDRRCGFVGVGVALFEDVCHCGSWL